MKKEITSNVLIVIATLILVSMAWHTYLKYPEERPWVKQKHYQQAPRYEGEEKYQRWKKREDERQLSLREEERFRQRYEREKE